MIFQTVGKKENPAVLLFHAMGVTGESSRPVAEYLKDRYYCIMQGFAEMLDMVVEKNTLPELPFLTE